MNAIVPASLIHSCGCARARKAGHAGSWPCSRSARPRAAQFEEGKKGELKAGEYADFIILSNDITKIPPAQYTKTQVLRTVVGGRTVYRSLP